VHLQGLIRENSVFMSPKISLLFCNFVYLFFCPYLEFHFSSSVSGFFFGVYWRGFPASKEMEGLDCIT
jgi:hypothetical protein